MSIEASEYDVDEANAERLTSWLNAGQWTREQATLLFLEIDPDRVNGECFSTFSGRGEVQYEYYVDEDPSTIVQYGFDQNDDPDFLSAEQGALIHKVKRLCRQIGRRLNLLDSAEPHEWIERACEKEIGIPWLDWAIKMGLYGQKTEPDAVSKAVLNAPAVEETVSEHRPAATGPRFTMTRAAMINQHKHEWPTIEQDMKDAGRGGLSAAKAGKRGWKESEAMEWARAKGKLIDIDKSTHKLTTAMVNMASLPASRKHICEG